MTTKLCAGRCGQVKDKEEFDWNRSGYSRKGKCRDCIRAEAAERTAAWRKSKRPEDWQPKVKRIECSGESHKCNSCGEFKAHSEYYVDETYACGFESKCKHCKGEARRDRWKNNVNGHRDKDVARKAEWTPEQRATWLHGQFVYKLRRDFNITEDQYNQLLEEQGGVCYLCKEPETRVHHRNNEVMRLAIDHDHRCCPESSKSCGSCVRSLLCYSCNMLMGKVELKPALAERFADYIDRRPLETKLPGFVGMVKSSRPARKPDGFVEVEPLRSRPSIPNRVAVREYCAYELTPEAIDDIRHEWHKREHEEALEAERLRKFDIERQPWDE